MPEKLSMSSANLFNLFLLAAKFGADVVCRMHTYLSTCREKCVSQLLTRLFDGKIPDSIL
jgi:hypothetical protein